MLGKDHPALGAFRKRKPLPDWRFIAGELAAELQRRMEHADNDSMCMCYAHVMLRVYDEANLRDP